MQMLQPSSSSLCPSDQPNHILRLFLGADIVGINCHFGPDQCIEACRLMKEALDAAGIKKHLIVQPLGYLTPDAGKQGFIDLPEFPFGQF